MPTAPHESIPTEIHSGTDLVVTLGWRGCLVLLVVASVCILRTGAGRRALRATARVVVRTLRTWPLRRMGASRKLARRLQKESWDTMCAHRGLTGLLRGKIRRTPYGMAVHVRLSGSLTADVVTGKLNQLETGLGVAHGSLRLVPGKKADRAVLAITLRDPLATAMTWPGHPSGDIRKPVVLGRDESGAVIKVNARQRFVVAGTSGAGKSVFLRMLGASAVASGNARLSYIDLKAVEASLWKTIPGVDVATTPEQVRDLVVRVGDRMRSRLFDMAVRGEVDHVPTPQEPAEIIVVDEGAELKRAGLDDVIEQLCSLAQLGRAADFWLVWASQYPTDKSGGLPVGIGTQAEAVVGLRVESARINRNVFGEDAGSTGWAADRLPGGGGWFLLRDAQHTAPDRARGFLLEPDDVRKMAPVTKGPQEPATRPVPPRPSQAPTCHLIGSQEPAQEPQMPRQRPARGLDDPKPTVASDILLTLAVSAEPRGVREIARITRRDPGAISRALKRLTESGEVAVNEDKKFTLVTTTADRADYTEGNQS